MVEREWRAALADRLQRDPLLWLRWHWHARQHRLEPLERQRWHAIVLTDYPEVRNDV